MIFCKDTYIYILFSYDKLYTGERVPFYAPILSLFFMYSDTFMDFTLDFYNSWEFYGFCSDIGLFDAVLAPLLKGGRFFLLA
jgi:hypothetical protein